MNKIIIASQNTKKRQEIEAILLTLRIEVVAAEATAFIHVEEDADSFSGNARKKAEAFAHANQLPALADDSGLCVDALDGAPGIYSARFAGTHATDQDNNHKLLKAMQGQTRRNAHFMCALHLAFPDDQAPVCSQGTVEGEILDEDSGQAGFGYDPLFYCHELGKSFACSTAAEKSLVSHRGRALRAFAEKLKTTQ
ncbi:MAG: RdgB/HAM1 family non-canonical purine NTP pyrophosphatase [Mariprofundaceae bacterium]